MIVILASFSVWYKRTRSMSDEDWKPRKTDPVA
jgi:hypothetical protein